MNRRPRNNNRGERMIDLFAEALSELGGITAASKAIGINPDYGKRMFFQIRRELGPQAI